MALRRREILNKIVYHKHRIANPIGYTVVIRSLTTKIFLVRNFILFYIILFVWFYFIWRTRYVRRLTNK